MNETRLYILCGLPFAGKTTLAQELVHRFGFMYIDVDQINTSFGVGLRGASISPEEWVRTYDEAYKQLADALNSNRITQHRHDVRDDNFAIVATHFEPPAQEEQVLYFRQSEPLEEWIFQNFKTTNF